MSERGEAIVLIGFMGAGKSSVGRALAAKCALPRYDTDEMVRRRSGLSIAEFFEARGEEAFREAETEALREIPRAPAVIVTGGGIVLRPANVELLRALGWIVQLTAEEEVLFERVSRRKTRPLLQTENPRARLAELLRARAPLYAAAADFSVETSRLSHDQVAAAILEARAR